MAGNVFGTVFRLATFGESHGPAIGGVVDGCPAGLPLDASMIQRALNRRRPGQSAITTSRSEADRVELLSGIFEGMSTGAPIGFLIRNTNQHSSDYERFRKLYRPGHADFTYDKKYGMRDFRGGGRSSARETACRVVAGEIARQLLLHEHIEVLAWVSSVGEIDMPEITRPPHRDAVEKTIVRCPDEATAHKMIALIEEVRHQGDSLGGIISCLINGVPPGIGEPVFNKVHAEMGRAMLSINAVKGFETGLGFRAARMRGSEHNDEFIAAGDQTKTKTNHSGGLLGGITNGEDLLFRVAFKPVSTIAREQNTVDSKNNPVKVEGRGRHDSCVVPRAVPIVEAMAALVMADLLLQNRLSRLGIATPPNR